MSKNTIYAILAVIGGIVVLGWVLKLAFKLIIPVILVALGYGVYKAIQGNKRIGGPQ